MKNVIITGASGNMGKAIVSKFLEEGNNVIGTVIENDPVPFEINDRRFEKIAVDLLDEEKSNQFIQYVIDKYKSIDVAVLTVGGFATGEIAQTKLSDISQQIRLNFDTAYTIARPVFSQMMQQKKGRIFLTGSRPGLYSFHGKGMVAYSLGKSLLFRLADLMNDEAKGLDVVTSIIIPSTIDTPQNRKAIPDADFSAWVKPEEIANVIHYYSSSQAGVLRDTLIKVYNNS